MTIEICGKLSSLSNLIEMSNNMGPNPSEIAISWSQLNSNSANTPFYLIASLLELFIFIV